MFNFLFVMICIAVGTLVYKVVSLFVDVIVEYISTTKWFIRWSNKLSNRKQLNIMEVDNGSKNK